MIRQFPFHRRLIKQWHGFFIQCLKSEMIVRPLCASSFFRNIVKFEVPFKRKLSTMPEANPVLISTVDKIRLIEFNRPEKKNAVSGQVNLQCFLFQMTASE